MISGETKGGCKLYTFHFIQHQSSNAMRIHLQIHIRVIDVDLPLERLIGSVHHDHGHRSVRVQVMLLFALFCLRDICAEVLL